MNIRRGTSYLEQDFWEKWARVPVGKEGYERKDCHQNRFVYAALLEHIFLPRKAIADGATTVDERETRLQLAFKKKMAASYVYGSLPLTAEPAGH